MNTPTTSPPPERHELLGRGAPMLNGRHRCVFCARIAAREYDSYGPHVVGFEPLDPVTPGHYLFLPRTHVEHAAAAPMLFGTVAAMAAEQALLRELASYNLITSGGPASTQSIPHLHVHLIPRTPGDGLTLPWTAQQAHRAPGGPA